MQPFGYLQPHIFLMSWLQLPPCFCWCPSFFQSRPVLEKSTVCGCSASPLLPLGRPNPANGRSARRGATWRPAGPAGPGRILWSNPQRWRLNLLLFPSCFFPYDFWIPIDIQLSEHLVLKFMISRSHCCLWFLFPQVEKWGKPGMFSGFLKVDLRHFRQVKWECCWWYHQWIGLKDMWHCRAK